MTVGIVVANTGSPASADHDAIEAYLREYLMDERILVCSAMSYGEPSIVYVLEELREEGADSIVLLPLYPQSAYSPTMAVVDSFHRAFDALGWNPAVHVIDNYHDEPLYIKAIADAIRRAGFDAASGDKLVLSLHAIPLKDEKDGDYYRVQVAKSAQLAAAELGIDPNTVIISYQSVFGPTRLRRLRRLSARRQVDV